MKFTEIRDLIQSEFDETSTLIHKHLYSEVPLIQEIGHYIVNSGGKRSRAVLALLAAKICQLERGKTCLFAAILEMIHAATLLHDDVVDASELRRGKASANVIYGNSASVLSGDFLYSRTFEMMVALESLPVLHTLAVASNRLAEGEMLQLQNCHHCHLSESDYLKVIECKTATLFVIAGQVPGLLSGANTATQNALAEFGRLCGIAFQLVDDVLDYTSDRSTMGKNQGDDLREGKMTLPLIYARARGTTEDRQKIDAAIQGGDASELPEILEIIHRTQSVDQTLTQAKGFVEEAKAKLAVLPQNEYTAALASFADLAVKREA